MKGAGLMSERSSELRELHLVAERKVRDLLPQTDLCRAEASGVLALNGKLLVIFDDTTNIGLINQDLSRTSDNRVIQPDPPLAPDSMPAKAMRTSRGIRQTLVSIFSSRDQLLAVSYCRQPMGAILPCAPTDQFGELSASNREPGRPRVVHGSVGLTREADLATENPQ
jgi:hypothetical protein